MTALNTPWTKRVNIRIARGEVHDVDAPAPGEQCRSTDDQERPHTTLEAHGDDAGRTITNLRRTGRPKQVLDRAPDHALASGRVKMTRSSQKAGMALATHSPHSSTIPTDNRAFCAPRPRRSLLGAVASAPSVRCYWPAPNGFQRNGEKTEAKHVGDNLRAPPTKNRESVSTSTVAEPKANQPKKTVSRRHQKRAATRSIGTMRKRSASGASSRSADDQRDTGDQEGDEIAEQHLAKERRPIKRQEGAEAADRERYDHAKGKSEACSDETQAVVYRLHWEFREALAGLLRRLAKQPLDAEAQSRKSEDEPDDGSPSWNFRLEVADGPLELVGQIGESNAQRNKMLADRGNMGIDVMRDRLVGGFALCEAWAGCCSTSHFCTFGSASNAMNSAISGGVAASSLAGRRPARSLVRRRSGPRQQGGRQKDRRNAGSQRSHRRRWSSRPRGYRHYGAEFVPIACRHLDLPVRDVPADRSLSERPH